MDINVKYGEISDILNDAKPIDKLLFVILLDIVTKTCHKNDDNTYSFSIDDEVQSKWDTIDQWIDTIHKVAPFYNLKYMKTVKKKVSVCIKHLCKSLAHKKISLTSKILIIQHKTEDKVTTKRDYQVNGIFDIE